MELVKIPNTLTLENPGLPDNQFNELIAVFAPFLHEIAPIINDSADIEVTDEGDEDGMKAAREARLAIRKIRSTVENARKEQKQFSLITGRTVDAVAKLIIEPAKEAEERLMQFEKFAEIQEAKRRAERLQKRTEAIAPFVGMDYNFKALEALEDDHFDAVLSKAKSDFEAAKKKEEEDRIAAEQEREAERERQRLLAEENKRLRAQAALREEALQKERQEAERLRREAEKASKKAEEVPVDDSLEMKVWTKMEEGVRVLEALLSAAESEGKIDYVTSGAISDLVDTINREALLIIKEGRGEAL